jgi:hypothetical protein
MRLAVIAAAVAVAAWGVSHAAPSVRAEVRSVGPFHAVEIAGIAEAEIQVGPAQHVEVVADDQAVPHITTTVRDGRLIIDDHDLEHCHECKVRITVPTLDALSLTGTGGITATGIATSSLAVAISGTGAIEVSGNAATVNYALAGTGSIDGKALAAKSANVSMDGTGGIAMRASNDANIELGGVGSIDVYGHPRSLTKSNSGMGKIRVRD